MSSFTVCPITHTHEHMRACTSTPTHTHTHNVIHRLMNEIINTTYALLHSVSHDIAHVDLHVQPRQVNSKEHQGFPRAHQVDIRLQGVAVALQVWWCVLAAAAAPCAAARARRSSLLSTRLRWVLVMLGGSMTLKKDLHWITRACIFLMKSFVNSFWFCN